MGLCKCGCKENVNNKSGYIDGHRSCVICQNKNKRNSTECCSKSCSAKLHWKRHPEMKKNRVWNKERTETRKNNPDWINNLSASRKEFFINGGKNWNDGLSKETDSRLIRQGETYKERLKSGKFQAPMRGKKLSEANLQKRRNTNIKLYGHPNPGFLFSKVDFHSKLELVIADLLIDYGFIHNRLLGHNQIDFINYKSKNIIEINGDYWHCNPTKYNKDYFNQKLKLTAEQVWAREKEKIERILSYGYKVFVIWEKDIKEKGIQYCIDLLGIEKLSESAIADFRAKQAAKKQLEGAVKE